MYDTEDPQNWGVDVIAHLLQTLRALHAESTDAEQEKPQTAGTHLYNAHTVEAQVADHKTYAYRRVQNYGEPRVHVLEYQYHQQRCEGEEVNDGNYQASHCTGAL